MHSHQRILKKQDQINQDQIEHEVGPLPPSVVVVVVVVVVLCDMFPKGCLGGDLARVVSPRRPRAGVVVVVVVATTTTSSPRNWTPVTHTSLSQPRRRRVP